MITAADMPTPDTRDVLIAFVNAVALQLQISPEAARGRIDEVCTAHLNTEHARATWDAIRQVETDAANCAFILAAGTLPAHYRRAVNGWQFQSETDARVFLNAVRHRVTELLLAQMFILGKIEC